MKKNTKTIKRTNFLARVRLRFVRGLRASRKQILCVQIFKKTNVLLSKFLEKFCEFEREKKNGFWDVGPVSPVTTAVYAFPAQTEVTRSASAPLRQRRTKNVNADSKKYKGKNKYHIFFKKITP